MSEVYYGRFTLDPNPPSYSPPRTSWGDYSSRQRAREDALRRRDDLKAYVPPPPAYDPPALIPHRDWSDPRSTITNPAPSLLDYDPQRTKGPEPEPPSSGGSAPSGGGSLTIGQRRAAARQKQIRAAIRRHQIATMRRDNALQARQDKQKQARDAALVEKQMPKPKPKIEFVGNPVEPSGMPYSPGTGAGDPISDGARGGKPGVQRSPFGRNPFENRYGPGSPYPPGGDPNKPKEEGGWRPRILPWSILSKLALPFAILTPNELADGTLPENMPEWYWNPDVQAPPRDPRLYMPERPDMDWKNPNEFWIPPDTHSPPPRGYLTVPEWVDAPPVVETAPAPSPRLRRGRFHSLNSSVRITLDTYSGRMRFAKTYHKGRSYKHRRKDKKSTDYRRNLRIINQTWGRVSEAWDFVDAVGMNVYTNDGSRATLTVNSFQALAGVVIHGWTIDIQGAARSVAWEKAQDKIIGKASQGANKSYLDYQPNSPTGITTGPAL